MADVKAFFQKAFPFIQTGLQLGGPIGAAASMILGKIIGKPDLSVGSIDEALTGITLTPELQEKLREAELQFQAQMTAAGFKDVADLATIAEADRASARAREQVVQDWTPRVLALAVVLSTIAGEACFAYSMLRGSKLTADGAVIVGRILGMLDGAVLSVLAYYFGSSAGSDRKTEIIANGNGKPH